MFHSDFILNVDDTISFSNIVKIFNLITLLDNNFLRLHQLGLHFLNDWLNKLLLIILYMLVFRIAEKSFAPFLNIKSSFSINFWEFIIFINFIYCLWDYPVFNYDSGISNFIYFFFQARREYVKEHVQILLLVTGKLSLLEELTHILWGDQIKFNWCNSVVNLV